MRQYSISTLILACVNQLIFTTFAVIIRGSATIQESINSRQYEHSPCPLQNLFNTLLRLIRIPHIVNEFRRSLVDRTNNILLYIYTIKTRLKYVYIYVYIYVGMFRID